MMKKIQLLYVLALPLLLGSCTKDNLNEDLSEQETYAEKISLLEKNTSNNLVEVPYKEGYVTIVTYGDDTLAIASRENETMFLQEGVKLPEASVTKSLGAISTKADDSIGDSEAEYKVTYVKAEDYTGVENISNNYYAIMFEDTKNADFDYNDLIIHAYYNFHYDKYPAQVLDIYVQGIALGSSKTIKLGVYTQTGKKYISQNVREDLFSEENLAEEHTGDIPYFVNTEKENEDNLCRFKKENKITCTVTDKATDYVVWFIEATYSKTNETDTFIAPTSVKLSDITDRVSMFSEVGRPYGIIKNSTINTYPCEKVPIDEIYPNFFKWIDGEIDGSFDSVALKISDDPDFILKRINSWKIWNVY